MWDEQSEQVLREDWAKGATSTDIAAKLKITDTAVRGKARRMGLALRGDGQRFAPLQRRKVNREFVGSKEMEATEPVELVEDPTDVAGVSLIDRADEECAWPIGDPTSADFGMCGETTVQDRPYCAKHMMRAYSKIEPAPQVRNAVTLPRDVACEREVDLVEYFNKGVGK